MYEIARSIARTVAQGLSPLLKREGFRKCGLDYYRTEGDAIQAVAIEPSRYDYGSLGRFRVNVGVHFPEVAEVLFGTDSMPRIPKEVYCILRATETYLDYPNRWRKVEPESFPDRWWTVDSTKDLTVIADELKAYGQDVVWPWLEKNKFLGEAAKTFESQRWGAGLWAAASARLVLGERDEAERLVRAVIAKWEASVEMAPPTSVETQTACLEHARKWAADHQLL